MLKDGTKIAAKKLRETSPIHDNQFKNEVGSLMKVNHRNIVKLIGYCYEIQKKVVEHNGKYILTEAVEKLLCYEYISNGSLDKHLFGMIMQYLNISSHFPCLQCLQDLDISMM